MKPLKGNYCYASHSGMGASHPAFWLEVKDKTKFYCFDTYGAVPKNYKKWKTSGYGMCGGLGKTSDVKFFIEAVKELNMEGYAATIHVSLVAECLKMGAVFIGDHRCPRTRFAVDGNIIMDKYKGYNLFVFPPENKKMAESIAKIMNHTDDYALGIE